MDRKHRGIAALAVAHPEPAHADEPFTLTQKEYLQGYAAGLNAAGVLPAVTHVAPAASAANEAAPTWFNTPFDDLCREERLKIEADPFGIWDRMVRMAERDEPPRDGDIFRFKYHGLFWVAPAEQSFMVRVRVPGNLLRAHQLQALAEISDELANGMADITTRGSIQIRGIAPRNSIEVLKRLADCGLSSQGAGADNIRNITNSPTAGIDHQELIDTRALARDLQFYLNNHRELFGLPRKFNIAFDGGGRVSNASDTNDIGFVATAVNTATHPTPAFRVLLAGITGHQRFATDCGILVEPSDAVEVAGAMATVFAEHGDRTNRKAARLCYLLDRIGVERFLELTEAHLGRALVRLAGERCEVRGPVDKRGHLGLHRQKQTDRHYAGLVLPVGRISAIQMRAIAELADEFSGGEIRLTIWQNALLPNLEASRLEAFRAAVAARGLSIDTQGLAGALVACTGNTGCRFAESDTKGDALAIHRSLSGRFALEHPINIHLTGCPHSCAQHYIGDIGLLGAQMRSAEGAPKVEGYHVYVGGGADQEQGLGRELAKGVPSTEVTTLIESLIAGYLRERSHGETFAAFSRRAPIEALQQLAGVAVR